jgi:hypothetical protein
LDTREKEGHDCAIGVEMVHISPAIFDDLMGKIQVSPTEFEPLLDNEQGDDLKQLWDHPGTA